MTLAQSAVPSSSGVPETLHRLPLRRLVQNCLFSLSEQLQWLATPRVSWLHEKATLFDKRNVACHVKQNHPRRVEIDTLDERLSQPFLATGLLRQPGSTKDIVANWAGAENKPGVSLTTSPLLPLCV